MILRAQGASVRYPHAAIDALSGVDLALGDRELVAVAGPNGCGKTTLVRALLGLVPTTGGSVTLDGEPVGQWSRGRMARMVALVPQREDTPFSWRVEEMVGFGRYARLGPLSQLSAADRAAIDAALERCDVTALRHRRVDTLSGGEWQRVRIARALAQEAPVLMLDEPTASLDLGHEMELFELMRRLVGGGVSALVVTHHLNVAARYADRMLLLDRGRVAAQGPPVEVLRAELISRVFSWPVAVHSLPDGSPQVVAQRPDGTARDYP